jgi:hypothetical protein
MVCCQDDMIEEKGKGEIKDVGWFSDEVIKGNDAISRKEGQS